MSNKEDNKMLQLIMMMAEKGDAEAQYILGNLYDDGTLIEQNSKKAVEWYLKAAEQGYAEAQLALAFAFHYGEGIKQNEEKAYEWMAKAADNGNPLAIDFYKMMDSLSSFISNM